MTPSFFDVELPESALAPDGERTDSLPAELVGQDRALVTPPRTLVNATTTEQYTGTVWHIYRENANQRQQYESLGNRRWV